MNTLHIISRIKKVLVFMAITGFNFATFAQTTANDSLKQRPAQVSFFAPMGTNGMESGKIENQFSINILSGYAGGLCGTEFGGFSNVVLQNATGAQFAGFSNVVGGEFKGIQAAGFSNVVRENHQGAQFAGFSNVTTKNFEGIQAAGFSNYAGGTMKQMQAAGFSNVANADVTGFQAAGFTNFAKGNLVGFQAAGFCNRASKSTEGMQVAGFLNSTADTLNGVQVSGFLNKAKVVNGSQIGIINICDTVTSGVSIGLISIVKNGFHEFEIGGGETFYANASYKIGLLKFYSIFSAGIKFSDSQVYYGAGYGLGTGMNLRNNFGINIEAVNYSFISSNQSSWYLTVDNISKLHLTVSKSLSENLKVYVGPTLNLALTSQRDAEGNFTGSAAVTKSFYTIDNSWFLAEFYPGVRLGVRLGY